MLMYKVVRKSPGGELYSLFRHANDIHYVPGQKTVPSIGLIFVFANPEDAIDAHGREDLELWECECSRPTRARGPIPNPNRMNITGNIYDYWATRTIDQAIMPPRGTFLVNQVTLTRKVMEFKDGWRPIPRIL